MPPSTCSSAGDPRRAHPSSLGRRRPGRDGEGNSGPRRPATRRMSRGRLFRPPLLTGLLRLLRVAPAGREAVDVAVRHLYAPGLKAWWAVAGRSFDLLLLSLLSVMNHPSFFNQW